MIFVYDLLNSLSHVLAAHGDQLTCHIRTLNIPYVGHAGGRVAIGTFRCTVWRGGLVLPTPLRVG